MEGAILSFVGLVIGAVLQFMFSKHLENKKHQRDQRAKAYADYLHCVSDHANLGYRPQSTEARELGARTADAKSRISLYGAPKVISAFATFERLGASMDTAEQRESFSQMVLAMRHGAIGKTDTNVGDLQTLLLGTGQARSG